MGRGTGYERTGAPLLLTDDASARPGHGVPLRTDVQGLRAVAVLLVVAQHVFGRPAGGFIGVDVFFCISGFLITGLLVREKNRSGRISMREFYARRARRILPMAVLVLVVTDLVARWMFIASRAHQTLVDSAWSFVFLANVHFAALGTSYFEASRPLSAVQQYWSLAVEEQFYLVWPLLLIGALLVARVVRVKRTTAVVGAMALLITGASLAFSVAYTTDNPAESYFSTATRAWELGLGALTAVIAPTLVRLPAQLRAGLAWLGVGVIVASAFVIDESTLFPGYAAVFPVAATAVVLAVGPVAGGVGSRFALGNPVSLYVGKISYSLYLWHWPAVIFANAYFGKGETTAKLVACFAAFALSALTFELIEDPIRQSMWLSRKPAGWRREWRTVGEWFADNQRSLIPTMVFLLLAGAVGAWNVATPDESTSLQEVQAIDALSDSLVTTTTAPLDPLAASIKASLEANEWGPIEPSLDSLKSAGSPELNVDKCININSRNKARCVYGPQNAPHLAVLVGDSVAVSYMPGIRAALANAGWRVQVLTWYLCPMVDTPTTNDFKYNRPFKPCIDHRPWAVAEVERLQPELVISASSPSSFLKMVNARPTGSPENHTRWRNATARMLAMLGAPNRRVVLLGGPPGSGNLEDCHTAGSSPKDCIKQVDKYWFDLRGADREAAADAGATYVDPLPWVCYGGRCPAVIGTTPVYWDGGHLTAAYAKSLAPQLAAVLLPA